MAVKKIFDAFRNRTDAQVRPHFEWSTVNNCFGLVFVLKLHKQTVPQFNLHLRKTRFDLMIDISASMHNLSLHLSLPLQRTFREIMFLQVMMQNAFISIRVKSTTHACILSEATAAKAFTLLNVHIASCRLARCTVLALCLHCALCILWIIISHFSVN